MGPRARYLGSEVPKEVMIWQDPLPDDNYALIDISIIRRLETQILSA
jgi:catalase-peroxidase